MRKFRSQAGVTEAKNLQAAHMVRLMVEIYDHEDMKGVELSPAVNQLVARHQVSQQRNFYSDGCRGQCLEMLYRLRSLSGDDIGDLTIIGNDDCRLHYCKLGTSGYFGSYTEKRSSSKSVSKADQGHFMIIFEQAIDAKIGSNKQPEGNVSIYFLGQEPEKTLVLDTSWKKIESLRILKLKEYELCGKDGDPTTTWEMVSWVREAQGSFNGAQGSFLQEVVKECLTKLSDLTLLSEQVKINMTAQLPSVDDLTNEVNAKGATRKKKQSAEPIEKQEMLKDLQPIDTLITQVNKSLQDAISKSLIGKKTAKLRTQSVVTLRESYATLFSKLSGAGQVPKVMYQRKIRKLSGEVDQFMGALEDNKIKASNILPPMKKKRRKLIKACAGHLAGLNDVLFGGETDQAKQVKKSLLYGDRNTAGGKQLSAREGKAQLEQDIAKLNRIKEFLEHLVSTLEYRDQVLRLQENSQMFANVHMSLLCPSLVDDELSQCLEDYPDLLKDNEVLLHVIGSLSIRKGTYEPCPDGVKSEVATKEKVDLNGREGSQKSGGSSERVASDLEGVDRNPCSSRHSYSLLISAKVGRRVNSPNSVFADVNAANTNNVSSNPSF